MTERVKKLWPELEWIKNEGLREKTAAVWELALSKSVLILKIFIIFRSLFFADPELR